MPTYNAISTATGIRSRSTISFYLKLLRSEGIIEGVTKNIVCAEEPVRIGLMMEDGGRIYMDFSLSGGKPVFSGIMDATGLRNKVAPIAGYKVEEE